MLDRAAFFRAVRARPFGGALSQQQVEGMTAVLDEWDRRGLSDIRWLAYMLATTFHETACTMQPIEEYGKGKGKKYGKPDPATGETYYGRGFVQLTWKDNYAKIGKIIGVDLVHDPDRALELEPASAAMFEGMIRGSFTGKKLANYFSASKDDPTNARRIINGTDCAAKIASYHKAFLSALTSALARVPIATFFADLPEEAVVAAGDMDASKLVVDADDRRLPPPAPPRDSDARGKTYPGDARPPMPSIPKDIAQTEADIAREIAAFNEAWDAAPRDADADTFVAQTRLKWRNYSPGTVDGCWGGMLRGAIAGFLNDYTPGVEPFVPPKSPEQFAVVKQDLGALLTKAEAEGFKRPIAEARANPTPAQLAAKAPETVPTKRNFLTTAYATITAFFAFLWNLLSGYVLEAYNFVMGHKDSLPDDSWTYLGKAKEYIGMVPTSVWLLFGAGGLAFLTLNAFRAMKLTKEAIAKGERL